MKKKSLITNEYSYTVIYEPVKEGGYQITVPLLQGIISYGRNFEEARKIAKDAIECHLEALAKYKERIPCEKSLLQEKIVIKMPTMIQC